jgi:hypothetical protein
MARFIHHDIFGTAGPDCQIWLLRQDRLDRLSI